MLSEKKVAVVLFFVLIVLPVCFVGAEGADSPRAVFSATTYDFGTVKQGEKIAHTFQVRNEGTAPLTIELLALSEGGMTLRFTPTVASGKAGHLTLEWNTERLAGPVESKAILRLNDPSQPRVELAFRISVNPPISFSPLPAAFISVFKGEGKEQHVRIQNNEARALAVKQVQADGKYFTATLKTVEPGRVYDLIVRVPPNSVPGRYREAVYLATDNPQRARIEIPVFVYVKNDVYANPEEVDFGRVPLADVTANPQLFNLLTQTFLVKKREGRDFEITKIDSDLDLIQISKNPPLGKSPTYRIDVALVPDKIKRGKIQGNIRIETNDPLFPELDVPVRGEVL